MGYANLNVHKLLYKPWQMHKITVCVTHGICSFLVCINHWKCIVQSALAMAAWIHDRDAGEGCGADLPLRDTPPAKKHKPETDPYEEVI